MPWAAVDAAIAEQIRTWGALSEKKLTEAIDALVLIHDPAAVRRVRAADQTPQVEFGSPFDEPGFSTIWARLYAPDAVALEQRVLGMARSVCPNDPRSLDDRCAAAFSALGDADQLACACGCDDCTATAIQPTRRDVVIHIVADADTVADARRGESADCAQPEPAAPAVVVGGGVIDASVLAAFLDRAALRPIRHPGDAAPEPRYRPSRALADFIRARDLTCRFPGCDRPADRADIDHTIPYPAGPTSAANLKMLCRQQQH